MLPLNLGVPQKGGIDSKWSTMALDHYIVVCLCFLVAFALERSCLVPPQHGLAVLPKPPSMFPARMYEEACFVFLSTGIKQWLLVYRFVHALFY